MINKLLISLSVAHLESQIALIFDYFLIKNFEDNYPVQNINGVQFDNQNSISLSPNSK